jgi:hypothetical protein
MEKDLSHGARQMNFTMNSYYMDQFCLFCTGFFRACETNSIVKHEICKRDISANGVITGS